MTSGDNFDRKKLIILRAVLAAIGAAVCATALWQYFISFPDVMRREFRIVITVVSAVVGAALMALSAKSFYRLGATVAEQFTSLLSRLGAKGVVAVVTAFVAAVLMGYLLDVIIRGVVDIWAVRLLADVLAAIIFAALFSMGFTKWIADRFDYARVGGTGECGRVGYLITAEALGDARVLTAAKTLINMYIAEDAYKALCKFGCDDGSIDRLNAVTAAGTVKSLRGAKREYATIAEYREFEMKLAARKRLIPIVAAKPEQIDYAVCLDSFAVPTEC